MIGCLWTCVHKQPIVALYYDSETILKFYNFEASSLVSEFSNMTKIEIVVCKIELLHQEEFIFVIDYLRTSLHKIHPIFKMGLTSACLNEIAGISNLIGICTVPFLLHIFPHFIFQILSGLLQIMTPIYIFSAS